MVSKFHPAFDTACTVKRAALVVRQSPFCFRLNILPHIIKHIIQRTKRVKPLHYRDILQCFSPPQPSPLRLRVPATKGATKGTFKFSFSRTTGFIQRFKNDLKRSSTLKTACEYSPLRSLLGARQLYSHNISKISKVVSKRKDFRNESRGENAGNPRWIPIA